LFFEKMIAGKGKKTMSSKPISELREKTVRTLFGMMDKFGKDPDIERWLEGQKTAASPDVRHPIWAEVGKISDFTDTQEELLLNYGDPVVPDEQFWQIVQVEVGEEICGLIRQEKATIYSADRLHKTWPFSLVLLREDKERGVDEAVSYLYHTPLPKPYVNQIRNILFTTWHRGGPHALKAREFLCHRCGDVIARERKAAETRFNQAAAITDDGLVYTADWVVVFEDGKMPCIFPGRSFGQNKITLSPQRKRMAELQIPKLDDTVVPGLAILTRMAEEQVKIMYFHGCEQCCALTAGKQKILFTHRKFCPARLPLERLQSIH